MPILYVADVTDESYFPKVIGKAFKGRVRKPDALKINDGVRIIVSRVTDGMIVMKRRVYNKSALQTMNELERMIEATPL